MDATAPVQVTGIMRIVEPLASRLAECGSVLEQSDCLGRARAAFLEAPASVSEHDVCGTTPYILSVLQWGIDRPLKRAAVAFLAALRSRAPDAFDEAVSAWIIDCIGAAADVPDTPASTALWSTLLEEQVLRFGVAAAGPVTGTLLIRWCARGALSTPEDLRATSRLVPLILQPASFVGHCSTHAPLRAVLAGLVSAYASVLLRPGIARDTVTLVCMALAAVARTLLLARDGSAEEAAEAQQAWLRRLLGSAGGGGGAGAEIAHSADARGEALLPELSPLTPAWVASLGGTATVAFFRALCVAFPPPVLGRPLPASPPATPLSSDATPCVLTTHLAPTILRGCRDPDPETRLHAIQSLESWLVVLRRTQAWLRGEAAKQGAPDVGLAAPASIISTGLLDGILRLVL